MPRFEPSAAKAATAAHQMHRGKSFSFQEPIGGQVTREMFALVVSCRPAKWSAEISNLGARNSTLLYTILGEASNKSGVTGCV